MTAPSWHEEVALVTGASGALGAAVARVLDAKGMRVALHYRARRDEAEKVAAQLVNECMVVQADLGVWSEVQDMVEQVSSSLGPIAVLVNNAGIRHDGLLAGQAPGEWAEVVTVNLVGTFHATRACLPRMLRRRLGAIVNVVSPAALIGNPGQTAYCASKAGVVGLTRALAHECGRRGVTVNALSPGFMATPMTDGLPQEWLDLLVARAPMRRITTPDEVAAALPAVIDTPYMTGQVVSIDGGLTA